MIKKLNHIAIIVEDLEQSLIPYEKGIGLKSTGIEFVESYNCRIAFLPIGDTQIELIQPLGKKGELAEFLHTKGGGLHHIAVEVDGIEKIVGDMESKGIEMNDKVPQKGAHNALVAFAKKESFNNVTVEFIQPEKNINSLKWSDQDNGI